MVSFPIPTIRNRHSLFIALVVVTTFGLCLALAMLAEAAPRPEGYQYVSPRPNAEYVSTGNAVTFRPGPELDPAAVLDTPIEVTGSTSGPHAGTWTLATDGRTLIFEPRTPFARGEEVTVSLPRGITTAPGVTTPPVAYSFTTSPADPRAMPRRSLWDDIEASVREQGLPLAPPVPATGPASATAACDSLPDGYPSFTVDVSDNPADGYVFWAPFSIPPDGGHMMILDDDGLPIFYRRETARIADFKVQPNGWITYNEGSWFYALDSTYARVDSFTTQNGYVTDLHDLQILPNGNALLMSYDPQPVGMDTVVAGGNPDAIVTGLVIQELDPAKNVVFQWRSWDHFDITDASVSGTLSLTDSLIDYVHGNAFELDFDDNILISSRHMNEITKIDHATGDIIWRFGRNAVNNDFTFIGDSRGFSHQHDIRRLPNGNITLFDNGNYLSPEYSRALEYTLNETSMTATLAWSHVNSPFIYAAFMGNVQRLSDGGTVIGWGGSPGANHTELRANGAKTFQLTLPAGTFSYRSFRFPWQTTLFATDVDSIEYGTIPVGGTAYHDLTIFNPAADTLAITCFLSTDSTFVVNEPVPLLIAPGDSATVQVAYSPVNEDGDAGKLHVRTVNDTQLVARVVVLSGNGGSAAGVDPRGSGLKPVLQANHPNPFGASTAIAFSTPREARATVQVFDLSGRLVRTLLDDTVPAGDHSVTWDGRDDLAREVVSGIYFYRLETPEFSQTRRLVRLN